jgi:hypothetical protein
MTYELYLVCYFPGYGTHRYTGEVRVIARFSA